MGWKTIADKIQEHKIQNWNNLIFFWGWKWLNTLNFYCFSFSKKKLRCFFGAVPTFSHSSSWPEDSVGPLWDRTAGAARSWRTGLWLMEHTGKRHRAELEPKDDCKTPRNNSKTRKKTTCGASRLSYGSKMYFALLLVCFFGFSCGPRYLCEIYWVLISVCVRHLSLQTPPVTVQGNCNI